mmetsp:Transcript_9967/g.30680  ORF Transcript_9967/g.30680 Transcript_9967/m.30680 type:complete len:872 (-) Transcript_9967:546-3161(-)
MSSSDDELDLDLSLESSARKRSKVNSPPSLDSSLVSSCSSSASPSSSSPPTCSPASSAAFSSSSSGRASHTASSHASTSSPTLSSSSSSSSSCTFPEPLGWFAPLPGLREFPIYREQVVRLLIQTMRDYGYSGSARSLEEESGVQMESEDVVRFRAALQHGDWGVAIDLIPAVAFSLPVQQRIRLAILQRKYEELLSRGCISEALLCLRTDFADSSSENAALLESMSSLMIEGVWRATDNGQQDRADLLLHIEAIVKEEHVPPFSDVVACSHIAQKGTSASFISRDHLEDSWGSESHALQSQSHGAAPVLSGARGEGLSGSASAGSHPVVSLLPRARLPQLLAQALALQLSVCQYHNVHHSPSSLFYDHCCSSETIPHISKEVFSPEPSTKFLHLAYSPDGRCLAASTETGQVYVWSVEKGHLGEQYSLDLRKTSDPVCFLCWSPDSSLMLSCTGCGSVFLSDMKAKVLLWKALFFSQKVNCCAWFPDGNSFVCAANDSRAYLVSLEKDPLLLWSNLKAHDIAVDLDGKMLYAIHGSAVHARSLDIERRRCDQVWCVRVGRTIESMSLSLDGALMLLSLTGPDEIYVLDVANKQVNQRFKGHRNGSTPSRNCFGGARDTFVAAGNDDGSILIWHRQSGTMLNTLMGHRRLVTCVAWNPTNPAQMASCSLDGTLRLWGNSTTTMPGSEATEQQHGDARGVRTSAASSGTSNKRPKWSSPWVLQKRAQARRQGADYTAWRTQRRSSSLSSGTESNTGSSSSSSLPIVGGASSRSRRASTSSGRSSPRASSQWPGILSDLGYPFASRQAAASTSSASPSSPMSPASPGTNSQVASTSPAPRRSAVAAAVAAAAAIGMEMEREWYEAMEDGSEFY